MKQLLPQQRELVSSLAKRLGAICGIKAVVLAGSHARGHARPESDIDLGLFYSDATPFSIPGIRELAEDINDKTALAEVAEFERAPRDFGPRAQRTLAHLGDSPAELVAAVECVAQLLRETVALTDGAYQPQYTLPK